MKEDEDKLVSILFSNLKGGKKKVDDWITIANVIKNLKENYDYSLQKFENIFSIKSETIREILRLLELPEEIQNLIKKRKILMDAAQRLAGIKNYKVQIKVAEIISDEISHVARDIIQYAKKNPNISMKDLKKYKENVLKSKGKSINIELHFLAFPISKEIYEKLKTISKKRKVSIERIAAQIIEDKIKKVKQ